MHSDIIPLKGGITAANGFLATGIKAGIKESGDADLAILYSPTKCIASGTFTTNKIRASSIDWCEQHLPSCDIQLIICNSGCANACTGERGKHDTEQMAKCASAALNCSHDSTLIASTGVIGHFLPMDSIEASFSSGILKKLSRNGGTAFARAILTTDLVKKEYAVSVKTDTSNYTIGGCAKGSGMIHPNMATMLAFITTDIQIRRDTLHSIVKRTVDRTFNNLTVDGDTSTNDMVLVLANGQTGYSLSTKSERDLFAEALFTVCNDLCKQIAADGEGATKRIDIFVSGARTESDAKKVAKAVANSNLTKCALFGNDPNWGRIACAIGYSEAQFSKKNMTISLANIPVFCNLQPLPFSERRARVALQKKVVPISIDLGLGSACAIAHTCDFSYDYVRINAEYHT